MGSHSVCFSFTPGENEQLETVIVIPEEHRSIIHGIVKNHCNKVIKDAVVKLYESINHHGERILKPLTHTFTDECGQFVFGPLWPCKNYVIKVWVNDVKIRELVIHPDECECPKEHIIKPCDPCDKKDDKKDDKEDDKEDEKEDKIEDKIEDKKEDEKEDDKDDEKDDEKEDGKIDKKIDYINDDDVFAKIDQIIMMQSHHTIEQSGINEDKKDVLDAPDNLDE